MVKEPDNSDCPDYNFVLGTHDGIAFLNIKKDNNCAMRLSKEAYFKGKIINHLLAYKQHRIVAFEYDAKDLRLIDRKTKETSTRPWPGNEN